jgi:hypothetical protein
VVDRLNVDDTGVTHLPFAEELPADDRVDPVRPDQNVGTLLPPISERRGDAARVLSKACAAGTGFQLNIPEPFDERGVQIGSRESKGGRIERARQRSDIPTAEQLAATRPPFESFDFDTSRQDALIQTEFSQRDERVVPEVDAAAELNVAEVTRTLEDSYVETRSPERNGGAKSSGPTTNDDRATTGMGRAFHLRRSGEALNECLHAFIAEHELRRL